MEYVVDNFVIRKEEVNVKPIEVLENHEFYDLVKLTPKGGVEQLDIVCLEVIDKTSDSVTVKFQHGDSVFVGGLTMYTWDLNEHCLKRRV